jgi:hypothetical protein
LLDWSDSSFYNVIVSLSVVFFLYHFEYRVVGVDACIVHLCSVYSHLIYAISLQCVQMLSLSLRFKARRTTDCNWVESTTGCYNIIYVYTCIINGTKTRLKLNSEHTARYHSNLFKYSCDGNTSKFLWLHNSITSIHSHRGKLAQAIAFLFEVQQEHVNNLGLGHWTAWLRSSFPFPFCKFRESILN